MDGFVCRGRGLRFPFAMSLGLAALLSIAIAVGARAAETSDGISVKTIAADRLPNVPGNTLTAVVVEFPPGSKTAKHHHAGFVFAYVLSGTVRSQLNGGKMVDYKTGQSWVEPPGTEHTFSGNPSKNEPAKLLAIFVAPNGAQLTTYDK
jgi:quercetin dioxygenase-like cupin family protein